MKKNISALTAVAMAAAALLAACGGGGGGSSSSPAASTTPAAPDPNAANVATPTYAAASAQQTIFAGVNRQRQQCGFPTLIENTVLDSAANAHAKYMGTNGGLITDTEVSSNPGFTGVSYSDRAVHFGYPAGPYSGGESAGYYTNATLSEAQYGQQITAEWLGGIYHIALVVWPVTQIGIGWNETTFNGFPEIQSTVSIANLQVMKGNLPLTFPCQGTTGVAYSVAGETPTPPNTSGPWGTPIAVSGNQSDTVVLQSGTITDTLGHTVNLQVLNSSTDPNKLLPTFEAVAYPNSPLSPNTTYSVSLTGTINGTAFSRSFSFTTGNIVG